MKKFKAIGMIALTLFAFIVAIRADVLILLLPYVFIGLLLLLFGGNVSKMTGAPNDFRPTVTVFIPTFNEQEYIEKKLENLLQQTYPIQEILVYDCSTDATADKVRKYRSEHPKIKLVHQEERIGMARTLNLALEQATSEIIVKTDCDSMATSNDALEKLVSNFVDSKVGGATGVCVGKGLESYFRKFLTRLQIAESNIDSTVIGHSTSLLAFRKSATALVNPESMAEDTEELVLLRKKGYKTIVDSDVVSVEDVPVETAVRREQKNRRAEGIIDAILRNRDMIGFNYGKFGLIILPMELFLFGISPVILLLFVLSVAYMLYSLSLYLYLSSWVVVLGLFAIKRHLFASIVETQLQGFTATLRIILHAKRTPVWHKVR